MKSFIKESGVKDMYYTPYLFALNGHMQAIVYLIKETVLKLRFPLKYEREMFTLSDGGSIALDWVIDYEGGMPRKNS
jgi:predicted alpha/beta-fold hydrolase